MSQPAPRTHREARAVAVFRFVAFAGKLRVGLQNEGRRFNDLAIEAKGRHPMGAVLSVTFDA